MSEYKINPKHALLCDDVRHEANGKLIIIGVYADDIRVGRFPITMGLTFWVEFEAFGTGEKEYEFKISFEPDEIIFGTFSMTFGGDNKDKTPGSFSFGAGPAQIQKPGKLILSWREKGGTWKPLVERSFIQDSSSAPSLPSEQLSGGPL